MLLWLKKYWYVAVLLGYALLSALIGISDVARNNDYSSFIFAAIAAVLALVAYVLGKRFG